MLSVFKLVSYKPGAPRELALRAPSEGLRSSKFSKLVFGYVTVVLEFGQYFLQQDGKNQRIVIKIEFTHSSIPHWKMFPFLGRV